MLDTNLSIGFTVLGGALAILLVSALFFPSGILRWLDRKRYIYEVTIPLSMLTPTEKFIFNSIVFLFFSMVIIATSLYLPEHLMHVFSRAYYYMAGMDSRAGGDASGQNMSWNPRHLFDK